MGENSLSDFFEDSEFGDTNLAGATSPDDLFSIFESLEGVAEFPPMTPLDETIMSSKEGEETPRLGVPEIYFFKCSSRV
ncbi:hypothetical protein L1049_019687 [Liquidambar formosana]|uniref:Uncharacterized protein n=1 Tax=Liquidambar formosana TaxID=63359 RepID=A0AAP0S644_LIQFO